MSFVHCPDGLDTILATNWADATIRALVRDHHIGYSQMNSPLPLRAFTQPGSERLPIMAKLILAAYQTGLCIQKEVEVTCDE